MNQLRLQLTSICETGFPIFSNEVASDKFKDTICIGAGPVRDCELCGRVHFNSNGEYMNEGELEDLLKKEKAQPDKFTPMDGQVHDGYIDDMQVVINCPCNGLKIYEDFIWNNFGIICTYLPERAKENLSIAQNENGKAQKLTQVVS